MCIRDSGYIMDNEIQENNFLCGKHLKSFGSELLNDTSRGHLQFTSSGMSYWWLMKNMFNKILLQNFITIFGFDNSGN